MVLNGGCEMNSIHHIIDLVLPYVISIFEIIGIIVVCWSGFHGFWQYCQNTFMRKQFDLQTNLAKGLAVGLEFKMVAEILKTVLIQSLDEIYMLGAVILLRALLSLLIHYELGAQKRHKSPANEQPTTEQTDKAEQANK